MPLPKDKPAPPARKPAPAFGGRPDDDKGLSTGLGVAQPTETDQPEPSGESGRKP